MITFYNEQLKHYVDTLAGSADDIDLADVLDVNPKSISWSAKLKNAITREVRGAYSESHIRPSLYRPFSRQHLYLDNLIIERPGKTSLVQPIPQAENKIISFTGPASTVPFSVLMVDSMPNFHFQDTGQCFPLYLYEPVEEKGQFDFGDDEAIDGYHRRDAITDAILKTFHEAYSKKVTKEDIFYYVYGILHSPEYRTRFAADLKKMLPRIPLTKQSEDFWAFSKAGRDLAEWHLNYETVEPWPLDEHSDAFAFDPDEHYKVQEMTFARPTAEQKAAGEKWDKTKIIYNANLTLSGIPLETYDYIVNGKSAIEWIMERYQVTRNKDSGIVNDPNDWCREHDAPRYIVDLLKRVVRVSIETMKIVKFLPALNERPSTPTTSRTKAR